jgi:hypothetical protein
MEAELRVSEARFNSAFDRAPHSWPCSADRNKDEAPSLDEAWGRMSREVRVACLADSAALDVIVARARNDSPLSAICPIA